MERTHDIQFFCTTDVHSEATELVDLISTVRSSHESGIDLWVDSGDFFEGNSLHEATKGELEVKLLSQIYDHVTVGNHGYKLYLEVRGKVVCCNVRDADRELVFPPYALRSFQERRVLVTGVIDPAAFATIPTHERHDHTAGAVRDAIAQVLDTVEADLYLILSHSGWQADFQLAEHLITRKQTGCVILLSGHCHSLNYGPKAHSRSIYQVKGAELGRGGVLISWRKGAGPRFVHCSSQPGYNDQGDLSWVASSIEELDTGVDPIGDVKPAYVGRLATDNVVWTSLLGMLQRDYPSALILLNRATLRGTRRLGMRMTQGDLIDVEPFGNVICSIDVPTAPLTAAHESIFGPLSLIPPSAGAPECLITTTYLAETALKAVEVRELAPLRDVLLRLLLI